MTYRESPEALVDASRTAKEWLRPQEVMERYGVGRTRLYTMLSSGELPSAKVGRTRHIKRSVVEEFFEKRMK